VFMRILRVMKIAKIFRAFRAMKFDKELVMIMESLRQSMVALFWVFVMLTFMLCVFALVILQGMAEHIAVESTNFTVEQDQHIMKHFGSMPKTMLTLYMCVTGGDDWGIYYRIIAEAGLFYAATFLFYTFFFTFALFNMLTGIFVEKTVTVATPDRAELALQERRRHRRDAAEFKRMCKVLDQEHSGHVTWERFQQHMHDDTMVAYMGSIGLDIHDIRTFFDIVSQDDEGDYVSIDNLVQGCMVMKGHATAIDMHQQLFEMNRLRKNLKAFESYCSNEFGQIEARFQEHTTKQINCMQKYLDKSCNQYLRRIEFIVSQLARDHVDGNYLTETSF